MKSKAYCFRYSNFGDKFANGFFSFFTNLGLPIITCYIIAFILGLTGIGKYADAGYFAYIVIFSIFIGIVFAIKYCVSFKGIILYDTYLEIITQTIDIPKCTPKMKIKYSDISSVFSSKYNLRYDRKKARRTFLAGDMADYVELTLKSGKQLYFSVYNQEEFVENVICKMKSEQNDYEK